MQTKFSANFKCKRKMLQEGEVPSAYLGLLVYFTANYLVKNDVIP